MISVDPAAALDLALQDKTSNYDTWPVTFISTWVPHQNAATLVATMQRLDAIAKQRPHCRVQDFYRPIQQTLGHSRFSQLLIDSAFSAHPDVYGWNFSNLTESEPSKALSNLQKLPAGPCRAAARDVYLASLAKHHPSLFLAAMNQPEFADSAKANKVQLWSALAQSKPSEVQAMVQKDRELRDPTLPRFRHKNYPATLAELEPSLTCPGEVFAKPFCYLRTTPETYWLWSVGANGVDDSSKFLAATLGNPKASRSLRDERRDVIRKVQQSTHMTTNAHW